MNSPINCKYLKLGWGWACSKDGRDVNGRCRVHIYHEENLNVSCKVKIKYILLNINNVVFRT